MKNEARSEMKIAILLPSLKFGGAERVALTLAKSLKSLGVAVDLLLMSCQGEFLKEANAFFNVIDLKADRTYKLPGALLTYINENNPDLIISSFWKLNICACLVRIVKPKFKLLLWEHSNFNQSPKISLLLYFITASVLYRISTKVIAVSSSVRKSILQYTVGLSNMVVVISNPIQPPDDLIYLSNLNNPNNKFADSERNIIWIGRLRYPKNPNLMLEAFSKITNKSEIQLTYLGDGDLRSDLEKKILALNLSNKVRILGFQNIPYEYLIKSDLLVLTSDYEGFGNVLVEAMYCGLRVVSTDCGPGINEIIDSGRFGTIVPIGDSTSLASAIEYELSLNVDKQTQINAAMRYHPSRIVKQFLDAAEIVL